MPLSSSNAKTKEVTVADGNETYGELNQHPASTPTFSVGVSVDRNKKCRRTMEDAHSFIYDFGGVKGQGYFAVFDGHAGKHAAEWCGEHFHEHLLEGLQKSPSSPVPDLLNDTFHLVDTKLSELAAQDGTHSGCTAVTVLLRLEDEDGKPSAPISIPTSTSPTAPPSGDEGRGTTGSTLRGVLEKTSPSSSKQDSEVIATKAQPAKEPPGGVAKRTLYTANVGDARAVLSRGGRAVRLTYDHKGSDAKEAKRITDAGGFVMNNRVNGVLAVTRSLGDSSMKEFVVGSPYTTETTLGDQDDYLIVACDGLWDVCQDQEAIDLIKAIGDAQSASKKLLDHALQNFSSDNLSVLVVKLKP